MVSGAGMDLANRIREYVLEHKVKPAREQGATMITIWAREIHAEMNLHTRMTVVSRAIDSIEFPEDSRVRLLERSGPKRGAAAKWVFEI